MNYLEEKRFFLKRMLIMQLMTNKLSFYPCDLKFACSCEPDCSEYISPFLKCQS